MQQSKHKLDLFLWAGVIGLMIALIALQYIYNFSGAIKALVWLIGFVVILALGFFTTQGQAVFVFSKASYQELQKVVWPSKQETIQTTFIVVSVVSLMGFVLWGIDASMMWIIGKITHLG